MNQHLSYETATRTNSDPNSDTATEPDPDTATDAATATRSGRLSK